MIERHHNFWSCGVLLVFSYQLRNISSKAKDDTRGNNSSKQNNDILYVAISRKGFNEYCVENEQIVDNRCHKNLLHSAVSVPSTND
jgi:hypothetical protein